jgi:hypothetical protein
MVSTLHVLTTVSGHHQGECKYCLMANIVAKTCHNEKLYNYLKIIHILWAWIWTEKLTWPCLLPASCCFLAWLILSPWKYSQYVPPKRQLAFSRLQSTISQKTEFFRSHFRSDCFSFHDLLRWKVYISVHFLAPQLHTPESNAEVLPTSGN